MENSFVPVSSSTPIRADLELLYRVDEGESNAHFVGSDNGDMLYELDITINLQELWIEGAGGGGGGGGGAAGAGPGMGRGGGGTGGNGAYCTAAFKISLRRGDKLSIRLGHGGNGGVGSPSLQNFGSSGLRGSDTILSVNGAVFLTFVGSNGGGGGRFTGGHHSPQAGAVGDTNPPSGIQNYFYAAGGVLGQKGADVTLPFGGRGGASGDSGGGGGGGASLRGTGGRGGHYTVPCTNVFMGINGHFGSGGGGGAGGGPETCDLGGLGGSGGLGYVWIYRPT